MKWIKKLLTPINNSLYLFALYFKRGALKSIFYFFVLLIITVIVGFLLETNSKVDKLVDEVNKILPTNRLKIGISQRVQSNQQPGILSLFGSNQKEIIKSKNFIKTENYKELKNIPGVKNIIPLTHIDFPMGVEFGFPGSNAVFRAEVIGIGMPAPYARPYIHVKNKSFKKENNEVPVLIATYLVQVFNMIMENNNIGFKITDKNVVGFSFNIIIGNSFMGPSGGKNFKDTIRCKVVGMIDVDYTYGLAFPNSFMDQYKKIFWTNFKPGYADSLMLEIAIDKLPEIEKKLKSKGYEIKEDTQLMKKISNFINQNKMGLAIFLKFISFVILIMGLIISFYTVFWMLRDKGIEFSLYRFFGSSNIKILLLYGSYLSVINLAAIYLSFFILKKVFLEMGHFLLQFKEQIPMGFQSILDSNFLLNPIILPQFLTFSFIFMEISVFSMITIYLISLNRRL